MIIFCTVDICIKLSHNEFIVGVFLCDQLMPPPLFNNFSEFFKFTYDNLCSPPDQYRPLFQLGKYELLSLSEEPELIMPFLSPCVGTFLGGGVGLDARLLCSCLSSNERRVY